MVYIPEWKHQLGTMKYTRGFDILHILNLGCGLITLREPCKYQQPRLDVTWLHVQKY
jgi:hypothetical protein